MILKELFKKALVHPWIYHLFNAVTVILSAVAWHSIGVSYSFLNSSGTELPEFSNIVMKNYQNMLALGIVAIGLSVFGFWQKQQAQNIESTIKISFYLMDFTIFCYLLCLIGVYLPLAFISNCF